MTQQIAQTISKELDPKPPLKLNLGAGRSRMEGFLSVDSIPFDGLDLVLNLVAPNLESGLRGTRYAPWPWADNSCDEIFMSHVLEHFAGVERVHIFNEMYRVLIPGGQAKIITPHWCSNRAYGDFTHQWPPVSEMLMFYLWKEWRLQNAPHNDIEFNPDGYDCDFNFTSGYGMHPDVQVHSSERQQFEMKWYRDACQDLHTNLSSNKKVVKDHATT